MYEHITYEAILNRMLARVREAGPELDTREGSLVHAALAPAAVELQLMYIELDTVLDETFADTQSRPYLARRAAERGITAKDGTKALRLGVFDADVPAGSRFMLGRLFYTVTARRSGTESILECETPGICGNADSGNLVPCGYIPGLTSAKLTGILSHGTDPETVGQLRARYIQSLPAQAFGGNQADYIQKAGAVPGVGGVKVSPAWLGGGTVLLTVTGNDSRAPSDGIAADVQRAVDPEPGKGKGIAPVGHAVTVRGANEVAIQIRASFTFRAGFDFSLLLPQFQSAAEDYFAGLRAAWASEEALIVRVSALEQLFLNIPGVVDMTGTALNGVQKNLTLGAFDIPVPGGIANAG